MQIKGKTVLVTGGLGCLGNGVVAALEEEGAKVYIFDCVESELPNAYKVDVTNMEEVKNNLANFDKIDVLINCAGEIYSEPIVNMLKKEVHSKVSWDRVINNNLNSCFVMSTCVAEKMVMNRTKGVIINFSSISAKGNIGQAAYSAAKAGIESFTKVAAKELGMFKIRACAIAPGFIETPSTRDALSESMVDYWKKQTPMRKLGHIEDVVTTIHYIIQNDYLSGAVINVDGGLSI